MPQGKELSMGMYTMCKNLTRHFVIDVGRLPSIETVPGPGKFKKHSLVPRILQFYKRFILMVILKDGDTHKSQGAGKDTSPHHPPSAQVLETVIPLLLEPQNSRIWDFRDWKGQFSCFPNEFSA